MSDYPGTIYTPRAVENAPSVVYDASKLTVGYAEDKTDSDDEIVAIQEELGVDPAGGYADVVTRLDALDTNLRDSLNILYLSGNDFKTVKATNCSLIPDTTYGRVKINYPGGSIGSFYGLWSIPIPQYIRANEALIKQISFYFSGLNSNAYISENKCIEFNPEDTTSTTHENNTTDITSGTSHTMSFSEFNLGVDEDNSCLLVVLLCNFSGGFGQNIYINGMRIVFNSADAA